MYGRFALGLPDFLRKTITPAEAEEIVRRGTEQREANFLRLVERSVVNRPQSPYAKLLKLARCEMDDLRSMVRQRGLESTLRLLREAGVYVTFEEFKGRQPIVRHGKSFEVKSSDFENPFLSRTYEAETGGTTGAGTRVGVDLDHLATQAAHMMLGFHAHGTLDAPHVIWRPVLPAGSGINNVLRGCRHGRPPVKWFSPTRAGDPKPPLRFRLANFGTVLLGRMCGAPIPWPENVTLDEAIVVARCAARLVEEHGACQVNAPVSRALRVSLAAQEAGLDLTGVVFVIAGEPPSPAKVAGISASGARYFTTYGFAEGGRVAIGCANPISTNDLHILRDAFEVFSYEREVPGADQRVSALNVTSLLLTSPQILLNAEMDDCGIVEERSCGCPLERLGYNLHVRDIYSYRKLTGEGVTLIGSEMIDILESVLPARFGGSPLDYQLLEEEDAAGFTRLSLIISPRVGIDDERAVIRAILDALNRSSVMGEGARAIWAQAGTLRIQRREPVWTRHGKLMPLHFARSARQPVNVDSA